MRDSTYYHQIDWRRAQFSLTHPDVLPTELQHTPLPTELALFLPAESIINVRDIRDWLHDRAQTDGRYRLFGYYYIERLRYQVRSLFRGIIVVFQQKLDVVHFRLAWDSSTLTDLSPNRRRG